MSGYREETVAGERLRGGSGSVGGGRASCKSGGRDDNQRFRTPRYPPSDDRAKRRRAT